MTVCELALRLLGLLWTEQQNDLLNFHKSSNKREARPEAQLITLTWTITYLQFPQTSVSCKLCCFTRCSLCVHNFKPEWNKRCLELPPAFYHGSTWSSKNLSWFKLRWFSWRNHVCHREKLANNKTHCQKKKQVYVQQRSLKNKIPLVDVYLVKERNITTSYKKTELFAIRNHGEMKAQKSNEEQILLPVNLNFFFSWNSIRNTF